MAFLWEFHDVSMIFLWDYCVMSWGNPVGDSVGFLGFLRDFFVVPMLFPCYIYDLHMRFLWGFYALYMIFEWDYYGMSIESKLKSTEHKFKLN